MKPARRLAVVSLFVLVVTAACKADAYDVETHRRLASKAAEISAALSTALVEDLMLPGSGGPRFRASLGVGLGSVTLDAVEWIGEGATLEDDPPLRVLHHFHDPFRPWSSAGLTIVIPFGESSIRWGEMLDQGAGGTWSWPAARKYFLDALIGTTPEARETAFARTFRALGHLTHLVQDATVPGHVRNDPHPPINADWYEGWIETKLLASGILDAPIKSPLPSVFAAPTDPEATLPIAGLIDTDRVTPDGGFRGLSDAPDVGLAELVNPNFFSRDTIFRRYTRPAVFDLGPGFFEPVGSGVRQYFPKRVAGSDAIELSHFVAEGPLYTPLKRVVATPPNVAWTLDDARVHEAYARELVPRAIGYSAALIDYFFRGRLDVDLFDDGDSGDPSRVRVEGTNASNEALVDGTLTIHAEGANGERRPLPLVSGVASTTLRDIPAGGDIASAEFRIDTPAERFVAVYQGRLGAEGATSGSPGAVIGKVLGGVRVEQVYAEDGQWKIRTPKGVFSTGLTTAEFSQVRWGDADSILVGRTLFGQDRPNRFASFRVERKVGSADFATTDGAPGLQLTPLNAAVFPFGMSAGTTVSFTQTVHYRQLVARTFIQTVHQWTGPGSRDYEYVAGQASSPSLEVAREETVTFTDDFPIVLDVEHSSQFSVPDDRRYEWSLMDVSADATGALRVLIRATLIRPRGPAVTVPILVLDRDTGMPKDGPERATLSPFFGGEVNPLLWAIIDPETQEVLASTADATVSIASQVEADTPPFAEFATPFIPSAMAEGVWIRAHKTLIGGPFEGVEEFWTLNGSGTISADDPGINVTGTAAAKSGVHNLLVGGWPKREVADAVGGEIQVGVSISTRAIPYFTRPDNTFDAIITTTSFGRTVVSPPQLLSAQRVAAGAAGERVVFVAQGRSSGPGYVVVWDGQAGAARMVRDLPAGSHFLRAATDAAAIVRSFVAPDFNVQSAFVPFDPNHEPVTVPNVDLGASFTLLAPRYLYNPNDFRFYRVESPPAKTALPAPLAGAGPATGSFHAIRLP